MKQKNPKEKLKNLLSFASQLKFAHVSNEDCELLIRMFKDLVKKETDHLLRAKSVQLMGEICQFPGANKLQIAEEILDSMHKESNHVVISQIFKTLSTTTTLISPKADVLQKILKASVKKLDDVHQDVRCSCLTLIGRVCPNEPIKISSGRVADVLELFSEFSADQDPRVRAVVYQSLLTLHQRNQTLDLSVYEKASDALNDDYVNVRLAAIKIVWVFSHISPDRMIKHPYSAEEEIRLLDDAFIKICNMVNDSSMKIRAEAVGLLGSLHDVTFVVLQQTLDKKLMSQGKKAKSVNERQLERFRGDQSGSSTNNQWSSGKVWGDNDPSQMNVIEDEIKLMNTGSCGVFVRALEDEYMEVRSAGIDSLCELANQNGAFASMSTDFLVDMFNDEIESVRLNSINSLMKLHQFVDLREDQLDTILECLNDCNQVIRDSVRDLLAHCTLATQACLYAVVLALLGNLKKYHRDSESIWSCMKNLGLRHPNFVSSLVPEILITHPYYAVPEPNIDDPSHISMATLIFNAAVECPSILSLLPVYAMNHYDYFRDSMPDLIPELKMSVRKHDNIDEGNNYAVMNTFFQSTVSRISGLCENNSCSGSNSMKSCINDLRHIKKMHKSFAPAADFLSLFLQCQQLLQKCRTDRAWTVPAALATNECSSLQNDVKELITLAYQLEFMFSGLSGDNINSIKLIRIIAHSLSILLELRNVNKLNQSKKVDLRLWETFLHRLHKFKKHVLSTSTIDDQLKTVLNLQESIEENLSAVSTLVSLLQDFFLSYPIKCKVDNRLRQMHVKIIEPRSNLDNPLRFSSGLTLAVDVVANLENIEDISNIYVKVIYPDSKVQIHKPKVTEVKTISRLKHKLVCKVLISHQTWTEACVVRISVAQIFPTDIKEELNNCNEINVPGADRIIRSTGNYSEFYKGYLDLCECVKVYVQPKVVTR